MNGKSHFMMNIFSTLLSLAVWFVVYYLLCYVFTVCLEYKMFSKLLNAAAQHVAMRNTYKLVHFLAYMVATVVTAFVISKTAKCRGIVVPGVIVFSIVSFFLIADFVIVRIMDFNPVFRALMNSIFELKIFGVKFNFVSTRFCGGELHVVSSVLRLLPLCLVYYYFVKNKRGNFKSEENVTE